MASCLRDPAGLARLLGVASLGIGLMELAMPGRIARWLGIDGRRSSGVLRALGAREVGHGIDLLTHRSPTAGVRARLAGDALDGALLANAGMRTRNPGGFATVAAAVLGVVALDLLTAARLRRA